MNKYITELESLRVSLLERQTKHINKVISMLVDDYWFSETAKRQEAQQIS